MLGVWYINKGFARNVEASVPIAIAGIAGWSSSEQFRSYCHWLGKEGENV
jgi:hypothetical protein